MEDDVQNDNIEAELREFLLEEEERRGEPHPGTELSFPLCQRWVAATTASKTLDDSDI